MSIAHIGGGDPDDDKPDDPFDPKGPLVYGTQFTVKEYGLAVKVSSELADEFGIWESTARDLRKIQASALQWITLNTWHSLHGPWSPGDPQCVMCTWTACIWRFWWVVERWAAEYAHEHRPRCAETRDGSVSVIHHVEPCTCHDDCFDEDY